MGKGKLVLFCTNEVLPLQVSRLLPSWPSPLPVFKEKSKNLLLM